MTKHIRIKFWYGFVQSFLKQNKNQQNKFMVHLELGVMLKEANRKRIKKTPVYSTTKRKRKSLKIKQPDVNIICTDHHVVSNFANGTKEHLVFDDYGNVIDFSIQNERGLNAPFLIQSI